MNRILYSNNSWNEIVCKNVRRKIIREKRLKLHYKFKKMSKKI